MTLYRHCTLLAEICASFQVNLLQQFTAHTISGTCISEKHVVTFWRYIVYMDICGNSRDRFVPLALNHGDATLRVDRKTQQSREWVDGSWVKWVTKIGWVTQVMGH